MRITPWLVNYNGMGTGPSLQLCVDFLLLNAPRSFGPAIREVEIFAHCHNRGRTKKTLQFMRDRFRENLATLPKVWFRRKTKVVQIAYFSRVIFSDELFAEDERPLELCPFVTLCREFGSVLSIVEQRLKPNDQFDVAALKKQIENQLGGLPGDDD